MDFRIVAALSDNYIHIGLSGGRAVVVDPGAAEPVLDFLRAENAVVDSVFITHKHGDHIGGLGAILRMFPEAAVFGPREISGVNHPVSEGDSARFGKTVWRVIETPGHTLEHLSFYCENCESTAQAEKARRILFCGDTLFAGGCGRLFEGDAATMRNSLQKLAALPDETRVYCGHEYTVSNLRFGLAVEPQNADLAARMRECESLRARGDSTLPSTIGAEKKTNPFLRVEQETVRAAAQARAGRELDSPDEVFAVLREWKDGF